MVHVFESVKTVIAVRMVRDLPVGRPSQEYEDQIFLVWDDDEYLLNRFYCHRDGHFTEHPDFPDGFDACGLIVPVYFLDSEGTPNDFKSYLGCIENKSVFGKHYIRWGHMKISDGEEVIRLKEVEGACADGGGRGGKRVE